MSAHTLTHTHTLKTKRRMRTFMFLSVPDIYTTKYAEYAEVYGICGSIRNMRKYAEYAEVCGICVPDIHIYVFTHTDRHTLVCLSVHTDRHTPTIYNV